jgi:DNA-directed RNA polymerase specialized sigma subunit
MKRCRAEIARCKRERATLLREIAAERAALSAAMAKRDADFGLQIMVRTDDKMKDEDIARALGIDRAEVIRIRAAWRKREHTTLRPRPRRRRD